jgi:hypothetical protein
MPDSELERLDPTPQVVTLSTGFAVEFHRLKTRQFFRLLKVLTHGAGPLLMQANLDFKAGADEFVQKLIGLVVISVPDAENEFIQFLASMCRPAALTDKPESQLDKQQKADNQKLWDRFNTELGNPDLDDLIDIVETIIRREAPEIQALGKRLGDALAVFQKTGQDKETTAEEPPGPQELSTSPEPSAPPSTSSPTSTDGLMTSSLTLPSAVSASV